MQSELLEVEPGTRQQVLSGASVKRETTLQVYAAY